MALPVWAGAALLGTGGLPAGVGDGIWSSGLSGHLWRWGEFAN